MSYQYSPRHSQESAHTTNSASPLRHTSISSTNSSDYSRLSDQFSPSRTSTMSSVGSTSYRQIKAGHKRGISQTSPVQSPAFGEMYRDEMNMAGEYKGIRQSLRPLPQAPNARLPSPYKQTQLRDQSLDGIPQGHPESPEYPSNQGSPQSRLTRSVDLHRANSITSSSVSKRLHLTSNSPLGSALSPPDLTSLEKSTTSHLRTLSSFAQQETCEDFSLISPAPSVVGLQGRRQLKRTDSTRDNKGSKMSGPVRGSAWSERNWMEKQRQFLQAYEYLCHIGEAKEWIEDIIHKPIPPIVQLEEALRNGVTLAEIVQALHPHTPIRIFQSSKLQFRHSDNIATFFRFLAEVELPELFRFELIDLYEKKNIPKVIYCIHALSWLLYRKGLVGFRIGNLVGQLEFEHHELEAMQKGLDKAGVSMPSFSGMSANFGEVVQPEPPPKPKETEEERIARELATYDDMIQDFQAQARAAMVRMGLGQLMQDLWDSELRLVDLQAVVRAGWAREIFHYRLGMKRFSINLQSTIRGFLERTRQHGKEQIWKGQENEVTKLQSFIRAKISREATNLLRLSARKDESSVTMVQAAMRGVLQRKMVNELLNDVSDARTSIISLQAALRSTIQRIRFDEQHLEIRKTKTNAIRLQAALRGTLQRRKLLGEKHMLQQSYAMITEFQATARGLIARRQQDYQMAMLRESNALWRCLQAISRGLSLRQRLQGLRTQLSRHSESITAIQSAFRGKIAREEVNQCKLSLGCVEHEIVIIQSVSRALCLRRVFLTDIQNLYDESPYIVRLQAFARAWLTRQHKNQLCNNLFSNNTKIISLQSYLRALLLRNEIGTLLDQIESEEYVIAEVQSLARGKMVREAFAEKKKYFNENMEKVIKVQSFVRAKLQGEAYKSLTSGSNPPVGTVKSFVHLLNDSDFDFDEEVEFERLRKTVVQHVRQNEMADQYITQLDIKIALLVKNKITLDEVVKHQKHFGGDAGSLLTNTDISSKDPFNLKALNKNSRRKLEHYQELFFILQTQPQYLARLFRRIRELATAEKESERIKHLIMGLFGYAQKRREEYYLVKLIARALKEEIDSCPSLKDYLRGNFFWGKLFAAYIKSPRDRKFMRDLLAPIIKDNVVENPDLDLESDPMQIYLSAIENEQLRTGRRSHRNPDIPREEAIRDEETKRTFIVHLQDLRDIGDQFLSALEDHLPRMPFGVRYIAQQMFESLVTRFKHDERGHILQIVGHWVWKSYLQPALVEPDKFGVLDLSLSRDQKRNVSEVAKLVGQVAVGRLFGGENVFLQPLNSYVGETIPRLGEIWAALIGVPEAETHFDIDEFNDLYARTKPTLYIKLTDIFSVHHLVAAETAYICPNHEDGLRDVVRELGSAKNNEHELMNVSKSEICITLNPKLHDVKDPDAEFRTLFTETKRCVLYIIRVQSGTNLMEIMIKPITIEDEDRWDALVRDELSANNRKRSAYSESNPLTDIASMSYAELKRTALENILRLEQSGRLSRHNHYQDLLNAIAVDIRTKHRRRVQRQRELEGVRLTLARLNDQSTYLEQQLKTYNDYIEQAMVTLQNKKGKKRFLMPFTKQWDHERELQRSGRVPKFGSFKYSAADLANRGIVVSWRGYPERQWTQLDITLSSNEVGIFCIEGSNGAIAMPGASAQVPLDDLLQAQFNNTQFLEFWGGVLKVNVNLFLHLIMRKFYKEGDS